MARVVPSQVVQAIDEIFPSRDNKGFSVGVSAQQASQVDAVVQLVQSIPPELMTLSGLEFARLTVAVSMLRTFVSDWSTHGVQAYRLDPSALFGGRNPIVMIRDALAACPDEATALGSNDLQFISDPELRASLVGDLGAVQVALADGGWKAATVLSGSLVEALLLWTLGNNQNRLAESPNRKGEPLERWDLHDYIKVAADLKLIEVSTAEQARLTASPTIVPMKVRAKRTDQRTVEPGPDVIDSGLEPLPA
jgi:hypothetical protein